MWQELQLFAYMQSELSTVTVLSMVELKKPIIYQTIIWTVDVFQ